MAHRNTFSKGTLRAIRVTGIVAALGLAVGAPAFAQETGQADIAVGYLRNVVGSMQGVNVQAALPLGEHWHLVGEINRSSGSDCSGCEPKFRDTSILGGFRYAWHPALTVAPFWQFLIGGLRSEAGDYFEDYCCGLGRRLEPGYTINYLVLQPGGGATFMVTSRFGVRAQANVQIAIPDQSKWEGISIVPRVVVGGVIRLGRTR